MSASSIELTAAPLKREPKKNIIIKPHKFLSKFSIHATFILNLSKFLHRLSFLNGFQTDI